MATGCWAPSERSVGGVTLCAAHVAAVQAELIAQEPGPTVTIKSVVYYATCTYGGSVKIGTSTNLRGRLKALSVVERVPYELLAAEPGYFEKERALHQRFAHLRITHGGSREHFMVDDELTAHMNAVRERHPNWMSLFDDEDPRGQRGCGRRRHQLGA